MRSVVEIRPGALGFDCDERLTREQYGAMRSLGCEFACRYLGDAPGDLTSTEIDDANSQDVGIVLLMHAYAAGWTPETCPGRLYGDAGVRHAMACKAPMGSELWADVEGLADGVTQESVILWSGGVTRAIMAAGYVSSGYIGAGVPCDSHGLYMLAFTGYWQSESEVPPVENRGYRMIQLFVWPRGEALVREIWQDAPQSVRDLLVDLDVAQSDKRGVRPRMIIDK